MDAEQKIKKTLNGNSDVSASVLRPNIEGLYSLIPLTQGKFAIVDDEDYEWLNQYKWYALKSRNTFYAQRRTGKPRQTVLMHRQILGVPSSLQTDHQNSNGLDNRKRNIRACTHNENQHNQQIQKRNLKYKGVSWFKPSKKWRARIVHNNQQIYLGLFVNKTKAAKAYDEKARELFGEFAYTNFSI